ncbi:DUF2913 family protein [Citrobacter freundii]|uniref:DUF2913 family protein n=1 Tax=Citrobacter freundii TaxID=546 RepID=UPI0024E0F484|nr:DUF2913 family protein [Citrobacter freundii]MDT7261831.1 DUF2913 family protein [Citrobacter freundii]WOR62605.1 DUF2913 family protein [Citrobacter freundii]
MLSLGRQKGPAAGLEQRLEYLLNSCGNLVMQQSDMFRLTHAIEHLKSQSWVNAVVTDEEWQPQMLFAEYAGTDVLLTRKSELECRFEVSGRLTGGIEFKVVGDSRVVMDVLSARGFDCTLRGQHAGGGLLALAAGKQESIVKAVR